MFHKSLLSSLLALTVLLGGCAPSVTPAPTSPPGTAATATVAASATPTAIVLTDNLGRVIRLSAPARRIVSIAPSNTEILFAIGAGSQVIGRDQNSDFPEQAKSVTNIGGSDVSDKLNSELILSLKPDLVLAANITPPEQIKALEDLGVTVFMLPNPTNLDGMYANLRTAAKLSGHATQADTLIASLQARVRVVEAKVAKTSEKPLVFYEIDGSDPGTPWTSGPGTFIDTLIAMAGGRNLGASLKDQWAQIGLEKLVTQNPDMIVLGDALWGGNTPALVRQRPGWATISAVRNNKVFPIDDDLMSRAGPRLVDGLEALARLLHPELFQ